MADRTRDHVLERAALELRPQLVDFLRACARPPALNHVRVDYDSRSDGVITHLHFYDREDWNLIQPRRDFADLPLPALDHYREDIRSLYSRLYEDELLRRGMEPARRQLRAMIEGGASPPMIESFARAMSVREDHLRRYHRSGDVPLYRYGVDPGRPGSDRTTVTVRARDVRRADMIEAAPVDAHAWAGLAAQHRAYMLDELGLTFGLPGLFSGPQVDPKAEARGLTLLKAWLAPEQRADYEKHRHFEVTGGASGKRYRIRHGRQMNIDELDAEGRKVCGWCFLPEGQLVAGDVMLAQKIALETGELAALQVANRIGNVPQYPHPRPGLRHFDEAAFIDRATWDFAARAISSPVVVADWSTS